MDDEAKEWLNDIGLRKFVSKFEGVGVTDVDDFCSIEGGHLDEMGLTRYQALDVVLNLKFLFLPELIDVCFPIAKGTRKCYFPVK